MGRTSKLENNPELTGKICASIEEGVYDYVAAQANGICYDTFNNWKKRGEEEGEGIYFQFFEAVKKAQAVREEKYCAMIKRHAAANWQAAAWILERTSPDRYGRRERVEHTGKDGGPIVFEVDIEAMSGNDENGPEDNLPT